MLAVRRRVIAGCAGQKVCETGQVTQTGPAGCLVVSARAGPAQVPRSGRTDGVTASAGTGAPFPVLDVTAWPQTQEEQMGSKRKAWIQQPVTAEEFLFKYSRRDGTGDARADDWAEKLAAELAALLGIATPPVELATRRNERGVVCRRMADPDLTQLVHGNELLARIDPDYADSPLRNNPHYSVGAVRARRRRVSGGRRGSRRGCRGPRRPRPR
jgi:hypothetical protein